MKSTTAATNRTSTSTSTCTCTSPSTFTFVTSSTPSTPSTPTYTSPASHLFTDGIPLVLNFLSPHDWCAASMINQIWFEVSHSNRRYLHSLSIHVKESETDQATDYAFTIMRRVFPTTLESFITTSNKKKPIVQPPKGAWGKKPIIVPAGGLGAVTTSSASIIVPIAFSPRHSLLKQLTHLTCDPNTVSFTISEFIYGELKNIATILPSLLHLSLGLQFHSQNSTHSHPIITGEQIAAIVLPPRLREFEVRIEYFTLDELPLLACMPKMSYLSFEEEPHFIPINEVRLLGRCEESTTTGTSGTTTTTSWDDAVDISNSLIPLPLIRRFNVSKTPLTREFLTTLQVVMPNLKEFVQWHLYGIALSDAPPRMFIPGCTLFKHLTTLFFSGQPKVRDEPSVAGVHTVDDANEVITSLSQLAPSLTHLGFRLRVNLNDESWPTASRSWKKLLLALPRVTMLTFVNEVASDFHSLPPAAAHRVTTLHIHDLSMITSKPHEFIAILRSKLRHFIHLTELSFMFFWNPFSRRIQEERQILHELYSMILDNSFVLPTLRRICVELPPTVDIEWDCDRGINRCIWQGQTKDQTILHRQRPKEPTTTTFTAFPPPAPRLVGIELNPGPKSPAETIFTDGLLLVFSYLSDNDFITSVPSICQIWYRTFTSSASSSSRRQLVIPYCKNLLTDLRAGVESSLRRCLTAIKFATVPFTYTEWMSFLPSFTGIKELWLDHLSVETNITTELPSCTSLTSISLSNYAEDVWRAIHSADISSPTGVTLSLLHSTMSGKLQRQLDCFLQQMRVISSLTTLTNISLTSSPHSSGGWILCRHLIPLFESEAINFPQVSNFVMCHSQLDRIDAAQSVVSVLPNLTRLYLIYSQRVEPLCHLAAGMKFVIDLHLTFQVNWHNGGHIVMSPQSNMIIALCNFTSLTRLSFTYWCPHSSEEWNRVFTSMPQLTSLAFDRTKQPQFIERMIDANETNQSFCQHQLRSLILTATHLSSASLPLLKRFFSSLETLEFHGNSIERAISVKQKLIIDAFNDVTIIPQLTRFVCDAGVQIQPQFVWDKKRGINTLSYRLVHDKPMQVKSSPPAPRLVGVELNPGPTSSTSTSPSSAAASMSASSLFNDGIHHVLTYLSPPDWRSASISNRLWFEASYMNRRYSHPLVIQVCEVKGTQEPQVLDSRWSDGNSLHHFNYHLNS